MRFFSFNNIKMRHLRNRSLEKCLLSYWFVNIKLFHPEWRNFDRIDTRFLDTREKFIFLILKFWDSSLCLFSITPMPVSNHRVLFLNFQLCGSNLPAVLNRNLSIIPEKAFAHFKPEVFRVSGQSSNSLDAVAVDNWPHCGDDLHSNRRTNRGCVAWRLKVLTG